MEYILSAENLSKSYGKFCALSGLSLHLPKGAIYGLVGKNGAGKTTFIRIICGLQAPTSGEYTLYGKKNSDKEIYVSRKRIGAVVETPAIYADMTAEENLREKCLMLGVPSFTEISEILKLVGLGNTGRKKAGKFSLGMKQRLGIALALAGNPDFIILDEPINGLDPQGIVEIRELILKLNRERGISFLISSHILDELSRIATHYGFIDNGRLVKEIGKNELLGACRKCTEVRVSDTKALARALDALEIEYEIISETSAKIYGEINVSRLVFSLAEENCELISAREKNETLETYFLNLVGGGENA